MVEEILNIKIPDLEVRLVILNDGLVMLVLAYISAVLFRIVRLGS